MEGCWTVDVVQRPPFKEVRIKFEEILSNEVADYYSIRTWISLINSSTWTMLVCLVMSRMPDLARLTEKKNLKLFMLMIKYLCVVLCTRMCVLLDCT